uniref:Zinc finger, BED domain containing 4 n=1 Tax=Nothobranchius kuhntae TaxID=321403 RepID=A0A1A8J0S2_NOTKU
MKRTGENVAARLTQAADAYIPPTLRVSVVANNAANMVLSVELLKGSAVRKTALKEDPVARTVAAARRLVGHFKKGHQAKTGLKEKQVQQKAPELKLIQDVATRWNSTCFMLERLLEQRWPITAILSDPNYSKRSDSSTLDMTTEQWNVAEDITDVLKL